MRINPTHTTHLASCGRGPGGGACCCCCAVLPDAASIHASKVQARPDPITRPRRLDYVSAAPPLCSVSMAGNQNARPWRVRSMGFEEVPRSSSRSWRSSSASGFSAFCRALRRPPAPHAHTEANRSTPQPAHARHTASQHAAFVVRLGLVDGGQRRGRPERRHRRLCDHCARLHALVGKSKVL